MIIGADSYGLVIKPNIIKSSPTMPIAQLSIFGWLVLGPTTPFHPTTSHAFHVTTQPDNNTLYHLLSKFWTQEELPDDKPSALAPDESDCETHFRETHTRDSSGRYIVRIPLKSSPQLLGNSYGTAHQCLQRVLKRLKRDNDYGRLYHEFMDEYQRLGHMVRVSDHSTVSTQGRSTENGDATGGMTLAHDASASGGLRVSHGRSSSQSPTHPIYYLPHHGVLKPDSTTTKLRVVFNGSSPTSSGHSVNDIMHTGANLLLDIFDVLMWIRQHRHIFATDITKMYRQVQVHEDDRDLQRILWIDKDQNIITFRLTTVTYGMKAAPFLAIRALTQLARDEGHRFPLAVPSITRARYVDDIFGGADTVENLIAIAHDLKGLCEAGSFPLAKWKSTDVELIKAVSETDDAHSPIVFDDGITKILGLKWLPGADDFTYSSAFEPHSGKLTKRLILSEVAQIFDPLGLISPVVVRAKMFLQELWLHKLNWDDELPSQLSTRWLIIREELTRLARLSIPRWLSTWSNSTVQIHGFSDASQLAMAAVVYLVVHSPSTGAKSTLMCSKTKVAPLKRLTIPRLELTAALLLSRLVSHVQATISMDVSDIFMWTDSQVTLTWIKTHPSKWKDFVRNRVTQIQDLSGQAQWFHVPGSCNPADCASRGTTTEQLKNHSLWWTGPPWITQPTSSWPNQTNHVDDSCAQEARPGISLMVAAPRIDYHWDLIYMYSSLNKILKLTALCRRFAARLKKNPHICHGESLSAAELIDAESFWVMATQSAFFAPELRTLTSGSPLPLNHPFTRLTAFVDSHGVIRVGGRLHLSALNYDERHPAILPRQSRLSSLIIDRAHRRTLHGGTQLTLSTIRQKYWIIGGRASVKSNILKCITCARHRGIRAQQLMGQLPLCRTTASRPFSCTGVDYAGPLTLRTWRGRGAKTIKGWICVFVCFASSAVHLEAVTDYSTDGFISCYRRFISRRGIPHTLHSDRGTNFVGADASLKQLFTQSSREHHQISAILSEDGTRWKFNPAAAPHMGGKWEAVVKSVKYHLNRTIGEASLTYEELSTLLSQIEALLNSRPLGPLSDDPDDVSALTPGHFLTGGPLNALPEPSLTDIAVTRLSRWQFIQQRTQQFWSQWSTHYLHRQQSISKWHHPNNNIKVGTLVLLTDERFPPSKWPLARVTQLHPGKDNLTRVVTLKTATSVLTRPISKLAVLPINSTDSSIDHQQTLADGGEKC